MRLPAQLLCIHSANRRPLCSVQKQTRSIVLATVPSSPPESPAGDETPLALCSPCTRHHQPADRSTSHPPTAPPNPPTNPPSAPKASEFALAVPVGAQHVAPLRRGAALPPKSHAR